MYHGVYSTGRIAPDQKRRVSNGRIIRVMILEEEERSCYVPAFGRIS
jgi:hypothetical protein